MNSVIIQHRIASLRRPACSSTVLSIVIALAFLFDPSEILQAQTNYQRLKSFGGSAGVYPYGHIIEGTDGRLYGTTFSGDGAGDGKIFRVNKNGTGVVVLRDFSGSPLDGRNPRCGLLEASDGALYGTCYRGGSNDVGLVFKINKDGSGFLALKSFASAGFEGREPYSALIEGTDGKLYGTTRNGGSGNLGTVYRLNKDGTDYQALHSFNVAAKDGSFPISRLLEGSDRNLYGVTPSGGSNAVGTAFRLSKDGGSFSLIHTFRDYTFSDGAGPFDLMEATDGYLYGTTESGGTNRYYGTVFRMSKTGTNYSLIHSFGASADGRNPQAGLIEGMDGKLYGTTWAGPLSSSGGTDSGTIFRLNKDGTGYEILRYLTGNLKNGDAYRPTASLLNASDGIIYGTTQFGGSSDQGTVFSLDRDGSNFGIRVSFSRGEGGHPFCGLVEGNDGTLYGTAYYGTGADGSISGSIFKISKTGDYEAIYRFGSPYSDGFAPETDLAVAPNGMLFGTASKGGSNLFYGTVYSLNPDGSDYSVLHHFAGDPDGGLPYGAVTIGSDHRLYGTCELRGPNGAGALFSIETNGLSFTLLHAFPAFPGDGEAPYAGVLEASDGRLYGSTAGGGANDAGSLFRINKDGNAYQLLYSFPGTNGGGRAPRARLLEGSDGALYGTTEFGGLTNSTFFGPGTLFKINRDGGDFSVLHQFTGGEDGGNPYGGLVEVNGYLYGTTTSGGSNDAGSIFKLDKQGGNFEVLHYFSRVPGDGRNSRATLLKGSDGAFYGTTQNGGETNRGTIFRLFGGDPKPRFTDTQVDNNGAYLMLKGAAAGESYRLEFKTNLMPAPGWDTVTANTARVDGSIQFVDSHSTNSSIRLYRAVRE
jgi:uncharacterized repeat protein (TIGR03803 family)